MTDESPTQADADNLRALKTELDALGMVVVQNKDEIHVRLSMLEYVKIRVRGGALHCESWVGVTPRARASWTMYGVFAVLIASLFLKTGVTPETLAVAFIATIALVFNTLRHLLNDNTVTRIQMAWLGLRSRLPGTLSSTIAGDSRVSRQLGVGAPPIGGGRPAPLVRDRLPEER